MTSQFTPPGSQQSITKALAGARHRARAARLARRAAQFNKFRLIQLNLVPLVDTFVSVVFFTLVTATVGELAPVVRGVNLPESSVGQPALQQLTLGIGPQVTLGGRPLMTTREAAAAKSDNPAQPLVIPVLYAALRAQADSIRSLRSTSANQSVDAPLAIQADRTTRYDLLSRVMQTARLAGFRNLTLQVNRVADAPARRS
jgi:biopolymer transport protein ExbD